MPQQYKTVSAAGRQLHHRKLLDEEVALTLRLAEDRGLRGDARADASEAATPGYWEAFRRGLARAQATDAENAAAYHRGEAQAAQAKMERP